MQIVAMDLFGTAGIRGSVTTEVTPELAVAVGRAVATELTPETVVVGHDGRTSSPGLAAAITAGLLSGGTAVRDIGMVPTPTLAYASRGRHGIMVTASHNPPTDNGIKLFVDGREYTTEEETQVTAQYQAEPEPVEWNAWGESHTETALPAYQQAVVEYVTDRIGQVDDLSVAVDCGTGMAGVATPQVLESIGASPIALNANVDGTFPARESKPTEGSLTAFQSFVADGKATLGIAHDGDADRIVILDETGDIVHEDTIVAVLAEWYTRASSVDDPVVITTPNASGRIDERVANAGGRTERVGLGHLHEGIIRERNAGGPETTVVFAAEPWKHIHPGFGGWIDGIVSATVLTALVDRDGLTTLTDPVNERPYRKANVRCPDEQKETAMERLKTTLPETYPDATVDTEYGIRLTLPEGDWLLVRPSGTEPYLRIYVESTAIDRRVSTVQSVVEGAVDRTAE